MRGTSQWSYCRHGRPPPRLGRQYIWLGVCFERASPRRHRESIARNPSDSQTRGRLVFYEPMKYGRLMWALRQVWLKAHGMKEYETTEHEEALSESDLLPLKEIFGSSFTHKFNFIAKTNRLRNRFGLFAGFLRWTDWLLLTTLPFLRRYCTCIVGRFEKV